jgi:arylsulfatase A-like enzyme
MTEASRTSWRALVAWVVCCGVLAGMGELLLLGYDKLVAGKLVFSSRHVLWMAPLGDVVLCALAAAVAVLAARGRPTWRAAVFAGAAVILSAWTFAFPELAWWAALVVAVGGGAQLARALAGRGAALQRWSLRLLPVLLIAWIGLLCAAVVPGWLAARASRPPAPSGARNVVLVTLDTVRAESLDLHGYERPTSPRITELARQGVAFDRAVATAPWTLPSHAGMFTGGFPFALGADWTTALDGAQPTLAEKLAAAGYATAGFVANLNYCSIESGLARGFRHYEEHPVSLGQIALSCAVTRVLSNSAWLRDLVGCHDNLNRKDGAGLVRAFLAWLDAQDRAPFFAFLNFYDAHQPFLPPASFRGKFGPEGPRAKLRYDTNLIEVEDWARATPEMVRAERDAYDATIAYVDHQVGVLLDELARRGRDADTVVIVTSDHGEQFGEHGVYNHGNSLYAQCLHVPLVIRAPERTPAGTRVAAPASLRDLPATVLDLCGVPAELPGRSLAVAWEDPQAFEGRGDVLLSQATVIEGQQRRGKMQSLVVGKYHYIRNGDGSEELYDFAADPREEHDLMLTASGREACKTFAAALEAVAR